MGFWWRTLWKFEETNIPDWIPARVHKVQTFRLRKWSYFWETITGDCLINGHNLFVAKISIYEMESCPIDGRRCLLNQEFIRTFALHFQYSPSVEVRNGNNPKWKCYCRLLSTFGTSKIFERVSAVFYKLCYNLVGLFSVFVFGLTNLQEEADLYYEKSSLSSSVVLLTDSLSAIFFMENRAVTLHVPLNTMHQKL